MSSAVSHLQSEYSVLTPFSSVRDGLRIAVKVTPKASRDRIGDTIADGDGGAVLKISVTAAPDRGKANDAVIRLLSKAWTLPRTSIRIASGATGRRKVLHIAGDGNALETRLRNWMDTRDG